MMKKIGQTEFDLGWKSAAKAGAEHMNLYDTWADAVICKIRRKMEWVSEKNKNRIPYTTDADGNYDNKADHSAEWKQDDGLNWWTNGFWGGIQWLLFQDTGRQNYVETARYSEKLLEHCFDQFYGLHHDVGFMYMPTAAADYRLTGNQDARRIAMHAANLLAGRFNPAGKFIRAWNDLEEDTRGWAIIDCLFNLSLLYWASEESRDPRFRQMAMMHADTVMKYFVREDGSVHHIVEFDPETGDMKRAYGGQGYAEGSSWTRGQAWAVYGFLISYIHTGKQAYLDTARKTAQYCLEQIPENGIIPVDFRQPKEPAWEDSCGACVLAGGFLELSRHTEGKESEIYRDAAVKILRAIDETRADWSKDCDAIVQNCSASYHGEKHHVTMVYADYFFIEAIYKLKNTGIFLW